MGHLDEARARSARTVTVAQALGDHVGLACASAVGSLTLFLLRGDHRTLQERAELCSRHSAKHGFAWWQHYAGVFLGWLTVMRGEPDEGIERARSAFDAWQATGMQLGSDGLGIVLADAYLETVRRRPERENSPANDGSHSLLTEALARIDAVLGPDSMCGRCYYAELLRMRGELLLARDGLDAAEALACFEQALAVAGEQGALAWELRATMSIVRLHTRLRAERASAGRQGDGHAAELAEARERLADVYGKFTEGFAFPDLQEAAALIGAGEEMLR